MREELRKIQTDLNITVVFVTHDQEEAMALSDRVIVMNKGTIEQIGSPSEIYDRPVSRYVADFIGEMNFLKLEGNKTLAVRPENVRVRPGTGGELDGYVRTVMMLGHYVEMTMDTDYGIVKTFISDEESSRDVIHPLSGIRNEREISGIYGRKRSKLNKLGGNQHEEIPVSPDGCADDPRLRELRAGG